MPVFDFNNPVKEGGADPANNSKLRDVIAKAKANNMPNDTIKRNIEKGNSDTANYEHITYEGYGVGGSAVIVECLTDNKNRTAGDVRHAFDKHGGSLGSTGCVSYLFTRKGQIVIEKTMSTDVDTVMMDSLENGADDVVECDDAIEIYTTTDTFDAVRDGLQAKGYEFLSAEIAMIPSNYVNLDEEAAGKFQRMLDALEDLDDVQEVYHNVENLDE